MKKIIASSLFVLALGAIGFMACTVDVPEADDGIYRCVSPEDCVEDYMCWVDGDSQDGFCIPKNGCSGNQDCPRDFFCDSAGDSLCKPEYINTGIVNDYCFKQDDCAHDKECVYSREGDPKCLPACTNTNEMCYQNPNSVPGWCLEIEGPEHDSLLVCVPCPDCVAEGGICQMNQGTGATLEDAVWCDGGSQSCINNEDCPTDESCIRTNAGDPDGVCIPRCTDPQTPCGTGESIDEYCLELELQQGGVETVCALCNPLCGDYQQCIGIGGQHPLSGAYLSCGCASDNLCASDEWCDTIDGYCKTGYKTCNYASPECPSDQFCNFAIGHCESSCTDDNHCSTLGWGGSLCVAGDANYSYNRCLPGCNPVGSTSSSDSCATVQSSDGANYINVWVPCHQECTDGNQCVATTVNAQDVESVAPYCECSTTNQSCPSGMYCETTGNYCAF